jgi:hypothetical protein
MRSEISLIHVVTDDLVFVEGLSYHLESSDFRD